MSTFFKNIQYKKSKKISLPLGSGKNQIHSLEARSILVDMEEGVLNSIRSLPIHELFPSPHQYIHSNAGSGNNWSVGYMTYGPMFKETILQSLHKEMEQCDQLQSFFLIHALGGGTGSGLGSYIAELLKEEFPDVIKLSMCLIPSDDDDVVTSPYNTLLSLNKLSESMDVILPIENQKLASFLSPTIQNISSASTYSNPKNLLSNPKKVGFDTMNDIVTDVMLHLTSSMRFPGALNVDINEINTNLVPFPKLNYLISSVSYSKTIPSSTTTTPQIDTLFSEVFHRRSQLLLADPKADTYLACALISRGSLPITDLRRNITKLQKQLSFVWWNQGGWKTGMCQVPPLNQTLGLLCLANNCCMLHPLQHLKNKFMKLYTRKANLHHYTKNMDPHDFDCAVESLLETIEGYSMWQGATEHPQLHPNGNWETWTRQHLFK
ncbi:Tubulin epsilon chain [Coelomomyces lativittatus]|nr:Tubulin epsilon chain [Coelomomyces lativittatus]